MANAVVTESITGNSYNYTQLVAALKTALSNAGFSASPYVDLSANTSARYWVYKVPIDSDQTKARANMYLRVKILDIQAANPAVWRIQFRLYYQFSSSTNTGDIYSWGEEAGIDIPQVPVGSAPISFTAVKHAEAKILIISQYSNFGYLSFFTPLNKIDGWDFDNINYCAAFIGAKDLGCLRQPGGYAPTDDESGNNNYFTISQKPNPYGTTNDTGDFYLDFFNGRLAYKRQTSQKYQLIPNAIILSSSSEGVVAYFSSDVAIVAANGLQPLTKLSDGSKNYLLAMPGNNSTGLAIAIP